MRCKNSISNNGSLGKKKYDRVIRSLDLFLSGEGTTCFAETLGSPYCDSIGVGDSKTIRVTGFANLCVTSNCSRRLNRKGEK